MEETKITKIKKARYSAAFHTINESILLNHLL